MPPPHAHATHLPFVNQLFLLLGIESWKPLLTVLLLPPVPLLLLVLASGLLLPRRRLFGWTLLLASCAGLWLSTTSGLAEALQRGPLGAPPALDAAGIARLRMPGTIIVVLGGGREAFAPEYAGPSLGATTAERLRYGIWLSRQSGLPLAFSGGTGRGQDEGAAEAEVAARIAAQEFGHPLRWTESRSRDTRENAINSLALLRPTGLRRCVLVTHAWHMRRAVRDFERAVADSGGGIVISAAPIGLAPADENSLLRWLPSGEGALRSRQALREVLALLLGA
jgi:uncharacterized SAM-binding protein YcdF (DUF218 family)